MSCATLTTVSRPGHVRDAEGAHRHPDVLADVLVDLLDRDPGLVLVAPELRGRGEEDAVDDEAGAFAARMGTLRICCANVDAAWVVSGAVSRPRSPRSGA